MSRANPASRRSTSASASGGRTIPAPVSPSLQPFRRLRALPSGETGPFDRRPLILLASPLAVLGPVLVVVVTASIGSASTAIIGGSLARFGSGGDFPLGLSPPRSFPGFLAG